MELGIDVSTRRQIRYSHPEFPGTALLPSIKAAWTALPAQSGKRMDLTAVCSTTRTVQMSGEEWGMSSVG